MGHSRRDRQPPSLTRKHSMLNTSAAPKWSMQKHPTGEPVIRHKLRGRDDERILYGLALISPLGEKIGVLDYAEHRGTPYIEWICIEPKALRRRGYATRLLAALQALYPKREIQWGLTTNDGKALQAGVPTHQVATEHAPEFEKLQRLQNRLQTLRQDIQNSTGAKQRSARERAYRCLASLANNLEHELDRKRSHLTVIETP